MLTAALLLLLLVAVTAFAALMTMLMFVAAFALLVFVLIALAFLTFLLIPFATGTGAGVVLGLFGVGFFLGGTLTLGRGRLLLSGVQLLLDLLEAG